METILVIAAANFFAPAKLHYRENLVKVSPIIRQIFTVHSIYIVLVLIGFALICLLFPADLLGASRLGKFLCGFLAILLRARGLAQGAVICRRPFHADRVVRRTGLDLLVCPNLEFPKMKIPVLKGTIKRRMLINFRVDPGVVQKLLPAPFRPKLHQGHAIAGICLIRLAHIRPAGLPFFFGISSENAAHRIAVTWTDSAGRPQEGVFVPRRDTDSGLSHLAGGRLFPGEHRLARFTVIDRRGRVEFEMESQDRAASVWVRGSEADALPTSSCFASLAESSRFFECGCIGYSPACAAGQFDGIRLKTNDWRVRPFRVDQVDSSFFNNSTQFPRGSIHFDHALIMRDIPHEWHLAAALKMDSTNQLPTK